VYREKRGKIDVLAAASHCQTANMAEGSATPYSPTASIRAEVHSEGNSIMLQRILLLSVINFLVIIFLANFGLAQESKEDILAGARVLTLQSALARGIQYNLDLQVEELNIPISKENVTVNKAEFDPVIEMGISSQEERTPTAIAFSSEDFDLYRETGGDIGIRKKFRFGLESQQMDTSGTPAFAFPIHWAIALQRPAIDVLAWKNARLSMGLNAWKRPLRRSARIL